jgi:transcriptional regulator with XRE-family HTH domain
MGRSEKIEQLMKARKVSRYRLSKDTGIPYTTLTQIINSRTKSPQIEALEKVADYFGVSLDYLRGESASSIIEARLEEKGMSLPELAEKANVPLKFLQNMDNIVPDHEVDGGEQCFTYISSISWTLDLPAGKLRTAFARQEVPPSTYPDTPQMSVEEDFKDESFDEYLPDQKAITSDTALKPLTPKDERDIAKDLEKILSNLESDNALAFNGEPMDDETKELMRISLENSMRLAKQIAKKKFTPKKYR